MNGRFSKIIKDNEGNVIYFNTQGPTELASVNKVLPGQGKEAHAEGFGSPLGRLKNYIHSEVENLTPTQLRELGLVEDSPEKVEMVFSSGVKVNGYLKKVTRKEEKIILFSFEGATVTTKEGEVLFDPSWGTYDMAVGSAFKKISSSFAQESAGFLNIEDLTTNLNHKLYKNWPKQELKESIYLPFQGERAIYQSRAGISVLENSDKNGKIMGLEVIARENGEAKFFSFKVKNGKFEESSTFNLTVGEKVKVLDTHDEKRGCISCHRIKDPMTGIKTPSFYPFALRRMIDPEYQPNPSQQELEFIDALIDP